MQNLYRRGGIWWARLSVPSKLRKAAGRSEFTKSTRSHDLTIAKMVAAAYLSVWRGQLLTLESPAMPEIDVLKIVQSAHEFTGDGYLSLSEAEAKSGIPAQRFIEAAGSGRVPLYGRLSNVPGYRVSLGALEPIDPELGRAAGVVIPSPSGMPASAEHHAVSDYLRITGSREVAKAILAEELAELEILAYDLPQGGGWIFVPSETQKVSVPSLSIATSAVSSIRTAIADSFDPAHIERLQRTAIRTPDAEGETNDDWSLLPYSEAVERYAVDPNGLLANSGNQDELKQRKKKLLLLSEFMGDLELGKIDGDTLRAFRDGPLKTLPANSNHLPSRIRKASMKDTVDALVAEALEWPTMTRAQQHDRMLLLSQLFAWLTEKKHLKTNPSASLRGETGLTKAQLKDLRRTTG